ncbi:MAG: tRNA dihydrouridine(20/20a) synthase DusA [Gammaproteobacteria bacterium]|nr:tRNA dihydrouridine(20/20a) synthase DusA [Gammaproteobacteria bacterium]
MRQLTEFPSVTSNSKGWSCWRFCIAPMMQYTDRHFRYLARCLSQHARLYTEMVVASAIVRGDARRFLAHDPLETLVALQLGGSLPIELALASKMGEDAGFCEINLNVGCPSDRVQAGRFGACLIAEPNLVAECVNAMQNAVRIPVTVKTRLGVDHFDSEEHLHNLVAEIAAAGCTTVLLHARKALLNFSPRANREIPPLDYPRAYRVKQAFPELSIVLNGGIDSLTACTEHLKHLDGVMLGRAAYANLALIADADHQLFNAAWSRVDEIELLHNLRAYLDAQVASGTALHHLTKHWLGLRQGRPGAREWRRLLATHTTRSLTVVDAIDEAVAFFTASKHSQAA